MKYGNPISWIGMIMCCIAAYAQFTTPTYPKDASLAWGCVILAGINAIFILMRIVILQTKQ